MYIIVCVCVSAVLYVLMQILFFPGGNATVAVRLNVDTSSRFINVAHKVFT